LREKLGLPIEAGIEVEDEALRAMRALGYAGTQ